MAKTKLLLTCSGPRAYLMPLFQNSPEFDRLIAVDSDSNVPMANFCKDFYRVPDAKATQEYVSAIKQLVDTHKVDAIVSAHDADLNLLSESSVFKNISINGVHYKLLRLLQDKWQQYQWLDDLGLPVPPTCLAADVNNKMGDRVYLIKPRKGSGSKGIKICNDTQDINLNNEEIIAQMHMPGEEFHLDILGDGTGNTISVIPKLKLRMLYGSTDLAETVQDKKLVELGKAIGDHIAHLGSIDVDVMRYQGKDYILDINPRIGGGFPFTCQCSPEYLDAFLKILRKEKVAPFLGHYRSGCRVGRMFSIFNVL